MEAEVKKPRLDAVADDDICHEKEEGHEPFMMEVETKKPRLEAVDVAEVKKPGLKAVADDDIVLDQDPGEVQEIFREKEEGQKPFMMEVEAKKPRIEAVAIAEVKKPGLKAVADDDIGQVLEIFREKEEGQEHFEAVAVSEVKKPGLKAVADDDICQVLKKKSPRQELDLEKGQEMDLDILFLGQEHLIMEAEAKKSRHEATAAVVLDKKDSIQVQEVVDLEKDDLEGQPKQSILSRYFEKKDPKEKAVKVIEIQSQKLTKSQKTAADPNVQVIEIQSQKIQDTTDEVEIIKDYTPREPVRNELIRRTKLLEEQLETKSSLLRCAMTRLTSCEKEKKEAEKTVEKLIGMANNNKGWKRKYEEMRDDEIPRMKAKLDEIPGIKAKLEKDILDKEVEPLKNVIRGLRSQVHQHNSVVSHLNNTIEVEKAAKSKLELALLAPRNLQNAQQQQQQQQQQPTNNTTTTCQTCKKTEAKLTLETAKWVAMKDSLVTLAESNALLTRDLNEMKKKKNM